jgi:membrane-associated protease RseP (regulator of RpoE activity)
VPTQDVVEIHYPLIFQLAHRGLTLFGLTHGFGAVPLEKSYLHPMAFAAWIGMFATALNLLPGGQLDGGHIVFSIAPGLHKTVSRLTILILIPMAVYLWMGWLVWAILLEISSFRHPDVMEWPKISGARRWLAVFGLVMLLLTFTPMPFAHTSIKDLVHQFRKH